MAGNFGKVANLYGMENNLLNYRQKLNMTQGQMAVLLGVHRQQYNRWEKQHVQPDVDSLWDIWERLKAKFPDMDLQDLLTK